MGAWTNLVKPVRNAPRLWIERLWIYEDIESRELIREIPFHAGLNIVWARTGIGGTGARRSGHSVGKTTLCALIRRCLGDDHWSGQSGLDAQLKASLAKGGVVARIHVDGECWTVLRPFGGHSPRSKAVCGEDSEAIWHEAALDYKAFQEKLEVMLLSGFPEKKIPVTQEKVRTSQILSWCTRDQGCRFTSYFDWRHGGGEGFDKPAQSKKFLILAVVGALRSEETALLEAVDSDEREIGQLGNKRIEQLRLPELLRQQALSWLRFRLQAQADVPFYPNDMFSASIDGLIRHRMQALVEANDALQAQIDEAQNKQAEARAILMGSEKELELTSLRLQRDTGAWEGRQAELKKIQERIAFLQQPEGRCTYGDLPFAECTHIRANANKTILGDFGRVKDVGARLSDDAAHIDSYKRRKSALETDIASQKRQILELRKQEKVASTSKEANNRSRDYLEEHRDQYIENDAILSGTPSPSVQAIDESLLAITQRRDSKRLKLLELRAHRSEREKGLSQLMDRLTQAIQDESVSGEFNLSDEHLFSIVPPAAAYDVLSILLGDLTCLADSASQVSHHPGFMIHDCPREADMDGVLYRSYMSLAAELADDLRSGKDSAPFQYIITTTTEPPDALKDKRYVPLELTPATDDGLLLRRRMVAAMRLPRT